jgi:DNA-nicking Smr family endonuclease
MAKKKTSKPADNDADLWARFTQNIAPTRKVDRVTPHKNTQTKAPVDDPPAPPAGAPPPRRRVVQPGPAPKPPAPKPAPPRGHGDTPGVDGRTAAKLKRGLMPIDGTLDLHGETRTRAQASLTRFIESRQAAGARCVLVITGKGLNQGGAGDWSPGVLRQSVPEWLNAPPLADRVLGFSFAQPQHGGSGALYVLLKRLR